MTVFFQFSSSPRQQFANIYYFDGSNRIFYALLRFFCLPIVGEFASIIKIRVIYLFYIFIFSKFIF